MTYRPTFLGFVFLALALIAGAIEVLGVYEYVREQQSSLAMGAASCFGAAVTPGLPALADWWWRTKQRRYWFLTWVALAIGLTVVITATFQRTGHTTDVAQQDRERADRAKRIAERTEADALRDYTAAQNAALKECSDARRTRCLEAEQKAGALRQTLAAARAALIAAPAAQSDALAKRLAVLLPVTEEQVRLIQPLFVPILVSLLSALFFAGWARLDFPGLTTEQAPLPQIEPVELMPPSPAPRLAITARSHQAGKFGALSAFLVSETEPVPGESIEIERTLYNAYLGWCTIGGVFPYPKDRFALELAHVGKAAGLTIEIRGREAFCLDRRLAA